MRERWKYRLAVWSMALLTGAGIFALYRSVDRHAFLWVLASFIVVGGFMLDYFVSRRSKP